MLDVVFVACVSEWEYVGGDGCGSGITRERVGEGGERVQEEEVGWG